MSLQVAVGINILLASVTFQSNREVLAVQTSGRSNSDENSQGHRTWRDPTKTPPQRCVPWILPPQFFAKKNFQMSYIIKSYTTFCQILRKYRKNICWDMWKWLIQKLTVKNQQACRVLFPFMVPDLQLPAQGRHVQYNFASRVLQFDWLIEHKKGSAVSVASFHALWQPKIEEQEKTEIT